MMRQRRPQGIGLRDRWYTPLVTVDGHLRGGVGPSPEGGAS
jgi:hypothetical protein